VAMGCAIPSGPRPIHQGGDDYRQLGDSSGTGGPFDFTCSGSCSGRALSCRSAGYVFLRSRQDHACRMQRIYILEPQGIGVPWIQGCLRGVSVPVHHVAASRSLGVVNDGFVSLTK
jgi:hypothetical protein